ncbi:unnamed protein product [Protopolystoma xenopodis]|uniref:Uncharacterized protein n=1 Tax=Protopolystoma xenopodis TaxID=117903 RepID=A0A3S5ABZ0_9PLAT|nr:unnamed protein product [Protopolystoma xenopodis]
MYRLLCMLAAEGISTGKLAEEFRGMHPPFQAGLPLPPRGTSADFECLLHCLAADVCSTRRLGTVLGRNAMSRFCASFTPRYSALRPQITRPRQHNSAHADRPTTTGRQKHLVEVGLPEEAVSDTSAHPSLVATRDRLLMRPSARGERLRSMRLGRCSQSRGRLRYYREGGIKCTPTAESGQPERPKAEDS